MGAKAVSHAVLTAYVRSFIQLKAGQLSRKPGFGRSDEEHLVQELTIFLLRQADKFRGDSNWAITRIAGLGVPAKGSRAVTQIDVATAAARLDGGARDPGSLLAGPSGARYHSLAVQSIFIDGRALSGDTISIAVTTYGTQSLYTHGCLEAIREWKTARHELIVACHDPSLLLEQYLRSCAKEGLIDQLIFTPSGYGHTKGVNACFARARGRWLFNVANDIALGPAIVNDCAQRLAADAQLGLIGWHWYNDGTFWEGDRIVRYKLRDDERADMEPADERNVRNAPWFTGRVFRAMGGPKWLCLCNTAFFGIRREVWDSVGGFSNVYDHYWADDFLNYAVLDQGLNIEAFAAKFRNEHHFHEIQYSHTDVEDRRRHMDAIAIPAKLEHYVSFLEGGLSQGERQLLYQIARALPDGATVLHVGLWRGTGLILFMTALADARFIGIDCFDLPGVSSLSAQPPVNEDEVLSYVKAFMNDRHTLQLVRANTLELSAFPSADLIFIDGGHTKECIENDVRLAKAAVTPGGLLIFHDYGQVTWPDVKNAVDAEFPASQIRVHGTLCVVKT